MTVYWYIITILVKTKIKIMKKIVMTMGAFFALSVASAQGGYVSLSAGYAGGTSNEVLGMEYDVSSATAFTQKNITGTNGSGIPITLAGGFMFSENIGVELGVNYFMGSEVISDKTTTFFGDESTTSSQGTQIRVLPQLVLSTGSASSLEVYSKLGLVLPVGGSTEFKVDAISGGMPVNIEGTTTGSFSLGYTASAGASFGLSDNLSLFGELQYVGLRMKSDTRTITSYSFNGTDILESFDTDFKETVSVEELNQDSNSDDDKPTEVLSNTSNFNSLGFNLGVKFKF